MPQKFANNAASILNDGIDAIDISLTVRTGDASLFPSLGAGDFFYLTLIGFDANGNEDNWEIVKVTGVSTDTFSVERAQEGTTAQDWISGTVVENRFTAATAAAYALKSELGTAAPKDTGTGASQIPLNSDLAQGNWNTAYGWGDHAVAGYLTAVDWTIITSKPATATRWPAWSEVTSKPTTFTPSAHTHPLSEVSDAGTAASKNIGTAAGDIPLNSDLNKANWDAAYGWGDHALAGYSTTDTTYSAGVGMSLSGTTFNFNPDGLTATTTFISTDEIVVVDGTAARKINPANINVSLFNNDAGYKTVDNNYYLSGLAFSTADGILTATVNGAANQSVDLDGRYALSSHSHSYDNYGSWTLYTDGVSRGAISSGEIVDIRAGSNVTVGYSATNNRVTISATDTNTNYYANSASFSGAQLTIGRYLLSDLTATMPGATTSASGCVTTGNQTWGGTKTAADFVHSSDFRLKENIKLADNNWLYDNLLLLKPRHYRWKESQEEEHGLIAQEVEEIFPEYVHTDEDGMKAVNYSKLTTALIASVQALTKRVEELEQRG